MQKLILTAQIKNGNVFTNAEISPDPMPGSVCLMMFASLRLLIDEHVKRMKLRHPDYDVEGDFLKLLTAVEKETVDLKRDSGGSDEVVN